MNEDDLTLDNDWCQLTLNADTCICTCPSGPIDDLSKIQNCVVPTEDTEKWIIWTTFKCASPEVAASSNRIQYYTQIQCFLVDPFIVSNY